MSRGGERYSPGLFSGKESQVKKSISKLALAAALLTATFAVADKAETAQQCPREGVICTQEYAPVICNDGQVYPNSCYAFVACAHGCQPYNEPI